MSVTAFAILGIYGLGLILAVLKHPAFGLSSYLWIFYNPPQTSWWGADLPDLRWSLVAAVITLVATARAESPDGQKSWSSNWGIRLLMAFTAWVWFQSIWAIDDANHQFACVLFTKYIILFYLIYRNVCDQRLLEYFCWAHILGCFEWGWAAYRTEVSGRLEAIGSTDVGGANGASMQLGTGLIVAGFMFLLFRGSKRWAALLVIPFILNGIILTVSRGAFISLLMAGLVSCYLTPKSYRKAVYGSALLGALLLGILAHELFWERIATVSTDTSQMDQSALGRVELLRYEWHMFEDYPLGVGHKGNEILSREYVPKRFLTKSEGGMVRAAHNTFMAVLVDHGFPGAVIFLMMQVWMWGCFMRLKSLDKSGLPVRLGMYRAALGGAYVCWLVGGQFGNFLKAEVYVWVLALLVVLWNLSQEAIARKENGRAAESPDLLAAVGR